MAVLALIWGSSFILMKRGLDVYTPYQVGALRMLAAFLTMFPFVINSFSKVSASKWKFIAATGILGNGIPAFLFPLAETGISSSLAGMMNSLTPVFTLIIGVTFFKMMVTRNRVLGVLVGLAGAVMLVTTDVTPGVSNDYIFAMAVIASTVCYAVSVNILRHQLGSLDSMFNTGFALLFVGPPAGAFLFSTDFIQRTTNIDVALIPLSSILILGVVGTGVSTFLFNKLIKSSGALFASSVTYLLPIVAVMWGFFDGEKFNLFYFFGLALVLSGVYLINKK
jgi:drug/metabolite transporter (DMT)-like permease